MTLLQEVERIRMAVAEELDRYRTMFESVSLTLSDPALVVWKQAADEFTAELKVEFYEDGNLVDIFEFFVCKAGVLTINEDEVRQWIRQNAPDVVQRRERTQ